MWVGKRVTNFTYRLLQTLTEEDEAEDKNTPDSQAAVDMDGAVRRAKRKLCRLLTNADHRETMNMTF